MLLAYMYNVSLPKSILITLIVLFSLSLSLLHVCLWFSITLCFTPLDRTYEDKLYISLAYVHKFTYLNDFTLL